MVSETISHYRIIKKLDRGGMGEVYLAEDTRLHRPLALKLLLAEHTRDQDRLRRFEQEARAASALNHPNILTIYEIGQAADRHYIATEYVAGETLRQRVARGPLPVRDALRVAAQMAEALAAAHARGIVHRDIKPENVMVREDGYVKVLDFGLAKLVEPRRAAPPTEAEAETVELAHTEPGVVMGTTQYMSPEQARGLPLDARTDIWSTGCVLYEMLTGRSPFAGETPSHTIVAILEDEPAPLSARLPGATPELQEIIDLALAKRPADRYQSASEMLSDLRDLEAAADTGERNTRTDPNATRATDEHASRLSRETRPRVSTASGPVALPSGRITERLPRLDPATISHNYRKPIVAAILLVVLLVGGYLFYERVLRGQRVDAIAVLPFRNGGDDPTTEWLSDGITETLINSLSPAPGIKVMSRNSVFRYKGRDVEPVRAARELGVGAVLHGEVTQRGDDLAVSVELIDARDNTQIWGEVYNRKISDVLSVQEDIAGEIATRLRSRLRADTNGPKRHTLDSEAYQDYLRGRYFWNKRTEEGFRKAVLYFEKAIERDPGYALAYAGLADTYALMSDYSITPPREAMPKARAAAERALQLDDALAEAHTSRAFVRMAYEWKWEEAEEDFQRAIELNPNYATAHQWYASYLLQVGRYGEALSEIKRAEALDPLSSIISANAGLYLYYARQYDRAVAQLRKTLELDKEFGVAHLYLGYAYLQQQGRLFDAIDEFQTAQRHMGDDPETLAALGYAYAVAGRRADAQRVLGRLRARASKGYVSPYFLAIVHAGLGDRDSAFGALTRALEDRHPGMILLKADPRFDALRDDARLTRIIQRIERQGE